MLMFGDPLKLVYDHSDAQSSRTIDQPGEGASITLALFGKSAETVIGDYENP